MHVKWLLCIAKLCARALQDTMHITESLKRKLNGFIMSFELTQGNETDGVLQNPCIGGKYLPYDKSCSASQSLIVAISKSYECNKTIDLDPCQLPSQFIQICHYNFLATWYKMTLRRTCNHEKRKRNWQIISLLYTVTVFSSPNIERCSHIISLANDFSLWCMDHYALSYRTFLT